MLLDDNESAQIIILKFSYYFDNVPSLNNSEY